MSQLAVSTLCNGYYFLCHLCFKCCFEPLCLLIILYKVNIIIALMPDSVDLSYMIVKDGLTQTGRASHVANFKKSGESSRCLLYFDLNMIRWYTRKAALCVLVWIIFFFFLLHCKMAPAAPDLSLKVWPP